MLEIKGLCLSYRDEKGNSRRVLEDISLNLERGGRLSIVGPSGCGKTSLLLAAAGLLEPESGSVAVNGRAVSGPEPGVSIILQDYGLFPWKTVLENVALPLRLAGDKNPRGRCMPLLEELGLAELAGQFPEKLSGGERQRVAIARALISQPELLLMDEAFSALDLAVRERLEELLAGLCARRSLALALVTHDLDEAIYLGEKILAFPAGGGRPALLENPAAGTARDGAEFQAMRALLRRRIGGGGA